MPALGAGHALLKWVTSFPGNPARGLPTVTGLVLLSDASNGMLSRALDAAAVTALRTGAAAVLAAETLGRAGRRDRGRDRRGRQRPRRGADVPRARSARWRSGTSTTARAAAAAEELGADVAPSREDALGADLLVTVTPGREPVLVAGSLRPGQHVSLMGADGPGKAEIAVEELARARVFCDDWEQASHNGDLVHAVEAGALVRGRRDRARRRARRRRREGRRTDEDITVFDSTGLAIQDLAVALAALERLDELGDVPTIDLV